MLRSQTAGQWTLMVSAVALLLPGVLEGQTVRGTVTEASSGAPASGAVIVLERVGGRFLAREKRGPHGRQWRVRGTRDPSRLVRPVYSQDRVDPVSIRVVHPGRRRSPNVRRSARAREPDGQYRGDARPRLASGAQRPAVPTRRMVLGSRHSGTMPGPRLRRPRFQNAIDWCSARLCDSCGRLMCRRWACERRLSLRLMRSTLAAKRVFGVYRRIHCPRLVTGVLRTPRGPSSTVSTRTRCCLRSSCAITASRWLKGTTVDSGSLAWSSSQSGRGHASFLHRKSRARYGWKRKHQR